jgi:hypothetical protein
VFLNRRGQTIEGTTLKVRLSARGMYWRGQMEVEKTWVKETYNNKGKIVIDELTFAIKI